MTLKCMGLLAILTLSILAAVPAAATGDLSCDIDDVNLTFSLFAPTNREYGTIVGLTEGEIRLKAKQVLKMGPILKLEREHLAQHWVFQRELRIGINVENDEGSLFLAIIAQGDKTGERYSGRYVLRVSVGGNTARTLSGRIKGCSAEG